MSTTRTLLSQGILVNEVTHVFSAEGLDGVDLVGGPETILEVDDGNSSLQGGQAGARSLLKSPRTAQD